MAIHRTIQRLLLLLGLAFAPWGHAASVSLVRQGVDVPRVWTPERQLFVKGKVGVSEAALKDLAVWLSREAPHWVVLLADESGSESWRSPTGESFTGLDAVEHALGNELFNLTGFANLRHPRVKAPDGAVFILFLKERKFSYYGSDIYDRHRLGEKQWKGNLDRPALEAMRNGGRITDAVRGSIRLIDGQLETALTQADNRVREAAAAQQQVTELAARSLKSAEVALSKLEGRVRQFQATWPDLDADSDLAYPGLQPLAERLGRAGSALNAGNATAAAAHAAFVEKFVAGHLDKLDAHARDHQYFSRLHEELDDFEPGKSAEASGLAVAARQALSAAEEEYAVGRSSYREGLARAGESLLAARDLRSAHETFRRKQLWAVGVGGGISAILLASLGLATHRRRRPLLARAALTLRQRSAQLGRRTDKMMELMQRGQTLTGGGAVAFRQQGYQGVTQEVGTRMIKEVDELFIMSSAADEVLQQAHALMKPRGFFAQFAATFSRIPYRRAIELLHDEPVRFSPKRTQFLVRVTGAQQAPALLGEAESHAAFAMSFEEILRTLDLRSDEARLLLDRYESAWAQIRNALEDLQQLINRASEREQQLARLAEEDGRFLLTTLFDRLIPSAQMEHDQAVIRAQRDPLGAIEQEIPRGRRKAQDAQGLAELVLEAREDALAGILHHRQAIDPLGLSSAWLDEALDQLSQRANRMGIDGVNRGVTDQIEQLRSDFTALARRAGQIRELGEKRGAHFFQVIRKTETTIIQTRLALASRLRLQPEQLLSEPGLDPSNCLSAAQEQFVAAETALNLGYVEAAENCLAAIEQTTGRALNLVEGSRQAVDQFADRKEACRRALDSTLARLPEIRQRIAALRKEFHSHAQVLQWDADEADATLDAQVARIEERLDQAAKDVVQAGDIHPQGRVLQAAELLADAEDHYAFATTALDRIEAHMDAIRKTDRNNHQRLEPLQARIEALRQELENPRAAAATRERFSELAVAWAACRDRIEAPGENPFIAAETCRQTAVGLDELTTALAEDLETHAEATSSLRTAREQLPRVDVLARKAREDRIPDSPAIMHALEKLDALRKDMIVQDALLDQAHGNWAEVDAAADKIVLDAGQLIAILKDELAAAQAALAALHQSADQVRTAARWRGAQRVRIFGSPGRDTYVVARDAMLAGDYPAALRNAQLAESAAHEAIQNAEQEVQRREREEKRRVELRRRQRRAAALGRGMMTAGRVISAFGSASRGGGGIGSSIGRSSGGSGFGRSTFSSGSGFGRSGW